MWFQNLFRDETPGMSDNSAETVMMMANGTIDRRVARTRALLHQALMSLILKKRYKTISIKNICDAANVGRSTFYAHYTSKDDLKRSGLEHMRRLLVERQKDALASTGDIRDRSLGFSLAMFEHARDPKLEPQRMDALFRRLAMEGVTPFGGLTRSPQTFSGFAIPVGARHSVNLPLARPSAGRDLSIPVARRSPCR
jgi:AcrR family transcriptional regulator